MRQPPSKSSALHDILPTFTETVGFCRVARFLDFMLIGLEVHAKLLLEQKLFSSAATKWNALPNTQVAPFDVATPGYYPSLNQKAVQLATIATRALQCRKVANTLVFDRKHYTYKDLPHGYQITQFREPMGRDGLFVGIPLRQIHLEMDSAKSITGGKLDYNRAGIGLIEIVTEPVFYDVEHVVHFVRSLRDLLRTIRVSDCLLERGSMRFDVNVSTTQGEGRCEIKNLNSFDGLRHVMQSKVVRQQLEQKTWCTVGFDDGTPLVSRTKEKYAGYRYTPEYDIPESRIDFSSTIPLTPQELRAQLTLEESQREKLIALQLAQTYMKAISSGIDAKRAYNFLTNGYLGMLNALDLDVLEADHIAEFIPQILHDCQTDNHAREVIRSIFKGDYHRPDCQLATSLSQTHIQMITPLLQHCRFHKCHKSGNFDYLIGLALKTIKDSGLAKPDPRLLLKFFTEA